MGSGSNVPVGMVEHSKNHRVYMGKNADGVKVGYHYVLPDDANSVTTKDDLFALASAPVLDGMPVPTREMGTLKIYGKSTSADFGTFDFTMAIKSVDNVVTGTLIMRNAKGQAFPPLTGEISQRDKNHFPANFKKFSSSGKNDICMRLKSSGTLVDIDLGKIDFLIVECGQIPFESNTHSTVEKANGMEIVDANGNHVDTLESSALVQEFAFLQIDSPSVINIDDVNLGDYSQQNSEVVWGW